MGARTRSRRKRKYHYLETKEASEYIGEVSEEWLNAVTNEVVSPLEEDMKVRLLAGELGDRE